jgi:hypothetical protein
LAVEISLRKKLGEISVDVPVVLNWEVPLFGLLLEELFDHLLGLVFGE